MKKYILNKRQKINDKIKEIKLVNKKPTLELYNKTRG